MPEDPRPGVPAKERRAAFLSSLGSGQFVDEVVDVDAMDNASVNCRLCGGLGPLQWSHIVPAWAYRRTLSGGPDGQPVRLEDGIAVRSVRQESEQLLCHKCEQALGKDEKYISGVSLQPCGSFPAWEGLRWGPGSPTAEGPLLDRHAVSRFAASVVWRASVSSLYPRVSLGSYELAFQEYLLGRSPFPSGARLVVELIRSISGPQVERAVVLPMMANQGGHKTHEFGVCGFWFRLFVGRRLPDEVEPASFVDTGRVVLSDGARLRDALRTAVQSSERRGQLASRRR